MYYVIVYNYSSRYPNSKKNSINNGHNQERSPRGLERNRPILFCLQQQE